MDEQTLKGSSTAQAAQSAATLAGAQLKQRQQYHNNNNNGNNNGKVRLLITPAIESYGSSRQQMDSSATITTATATLTTTNNIDSYHNQRQQQQQQQQQRSQLQNNRQKNYHHYDYYTDSDLTSSLLHTSSVANNNNNYDQNILLFATEHNYSHRSNNNNGNQPRQADKLQSATVGQQHLAYSQKQAEVHSRSAAQQSPFGSQLYGTTQTGKFINHYPSWRQTHSPTTNPQNCSFHVPSHLQYGHRRHHHPPARPQSRYGYVIPGGDRTIRPMNRSSFKSRTLAHIPQSVREDQRPVTGIRLEQKGDEPEGEINYYDQPSLATRQFMLSEGDLLKVRSVALDDGPENPFKPGTELSWEAEMMVRLMKRGYPIQELPALVETAKQVARSESRAGPKTAATLAAGDNLEGARDSGDKDGGVLRAPQRRQSSHDLSEVKQVWANSLSRAKSMPRFNTAEQADSIDLLITSIENETMMLVDQDSGKESTGKEDNEQAFVIMDNDNTPHTPHRVSRGRKSFGNSGGKSNAAAPSSTVTKKTNNKRTTSEQQVASDRRNRKSAAVAKQPKGKYNHHQQQQLVKETAASNSKLDLKATKEIKKRNTNCCTIQ